MSRKKCIKVVNPVFVHNISGLVKKTGGPYAFADKLSISYEAVRRWCNGTNLPDGSALLKIQEVFDVSLDWLLTGKNTKLSDLLASWPEDVRDACLKAKEIIESKDPVITTVLISNIAAFHDAIKKKEDNQALAKKVDDLQKEVTYIKKISKPGSRTGTD